MIAAWSGQSIRLQRGDIIVQAAKQRRGHLRVVTRDSIASVKGTVFAVSTGLAGSLVSVVEGSVAVNQPGRDVVLSPGEQAASNPALASSVQEAVSWSPEAEEYLELLASFAKIERQLAEICSWRAAHRLGPPLVASGGRVHLRRRPQPRREDRPGPGAGRAAGVRERRVRGLVELRDGTAVETDGRPRPVGEFAAR